MHARIREPLSTSFLFFSSYVLFLWLTQTQSSYHLTLDKHQLWFGPVRYFKLLIWGQESFWLSPEFSYNHLSFISLHWRSSSWREISEMGRRHFSKWGERLIGDLKSLLNDLKSLLNRKEPVNFRGNYFVARQGPRGNLWPKYFLVSGSGNDSTQMEFTMEEWMEWPHPSAQQRPLSLAYSNIMSAPQALLAGCFFFFLDCFHFFTEDCPHLLATWDWGEPWFGRRKGEVHGGLLNWIALLPWPFPWIIGLCALKCREVPVSQAWKKATETFIQPPFQL